MKVITRFFMSSLLVLACNKSISKHAQDITEFDIQKNAGAILIDVRTPQEYASGHLPDAKSINFFDNNFKDQFASFNKEETIYLYCRSGNRSAKAQKRLKSLGFTNIINLKGGFLKWESFGKPVAY